jgi:homoprotocatechuate degradation regulator HpaR
MTRQPAAAPAARAPRFSHRNLPMLLLRAREGVLAHFRPILKAHGVTEQQWRIVRVLMDSGPLEPRQLVELCCISSPSLAGILARMDELGLVARERVGHDQRRVHVSLTPASRRLAARMAPQIEAVYRDIEAHIGADFTARFYRTLDELITMMDEPALMATAVVRTPEFALRKARRLTRRAA